MVQVDNRCVMCGEIVPEGQEVCPTCKSKTMEGKQSMNNRNSEGYYDPTAYQGMKEVVKQESELDRKVHSMVHCIKDVAGLAGFEVENRIVLKHKKTGKVFR